MKRSSAVTVWTAAFLLMSAAMVIAVDKKGTIPELKERLEKTTKPNDRIELAIAIVERQFDAADKAYAAGDSDAGQKAMADVEQYGVMAANESATSGKRMKHTEIDLRKLEDRLDNLAKSVDIEVRQPVRDTQNKIDKARSALLLRMFK